jgi:hypothetical protein
MAVVVAESNRAHVTKNFFILERAAGHGAKLEREIFLEWVSVEASQKHPAEVLLARQGNGLRGGAGGNGGNGGNEKPE